MDSITYPLDYHQFRVWFSVNKIVTNETRLVGRYENSAGSGMSV